MICPKCKAMLPNNLISCTKCGAILQPNYQFNDNSSANGNQPYNGQPIYNNGSGPLYGHNPNVQQNSGMGSGPLYGQNPNEQQNTGMGSGPLYGQNPNTQQNLYGQSYQQGSNSANGNWVNGKWVPNQQPQQVYNNNPNWNKPQKKSNSGCLTGCLVVIVLFIMFCAIVPALSRYINKAREEQNGTSSTTASGDVNEITTEATTEEVIVATVTDAVIYEGNDVVVELKSLEDNTLKFYVENNSSKNLSTSMHAYAINGYMADNNIYDMNQSIAANSKANISFKIPKTLESGYEVTEIKRMDFLIWFYDDDASFKDFDTGVLTVETNLADGKLDNDIGSEELLNENNISYKLVEKDEDKVVIGINNNSDTYYDFDGKNVVVNGYSLDVTYNLDIYDKLVFPDCSYPMTFEYNWSSDGNFKDDNDIDKIETVTLNFGIRPNSDYFSESSTSQISIEY